MDAIEKGIIHLLGNGGTFYAEFFLRCRRVEGTLPENALMAMAVKNGRLYLYTDCKRIAHLSIKQVANGLMHEALHFYMEHAERRCDRNPDAWNIAGDLAINCLIEGMDVGLIPGQGVFKDWEPNLTAEEYFDKLPKNGGAPKCNGNCKAGKGQGGDGECTCNPPNCSGAREQLDDFAKEVIKRVTKDAKESHEKAHGSLPGDLQLILDKFLKPPKVNWKVVLRQFVAQTVKASQKKTWRKENRRGLPLKGAQTERRARIVLALDTSGSIFADKDTLMEFYSEIRGIQKVYKADIDVIECDAKVTNVYKLRKTSPMPEPTGGGGTSFIPVFEYVREKRIKADLLIYLTDLYGSFPERETIRTLWLVCKNGDNKVPFGRVLKIT